MKLITLFGSMCIFVFTISCTTEKTTFYKAYLNNQSSHSISILYYNNGIVYEDDTLKLMPYEEIIYADGYDRGIKQTPGFDALKYNVGLNDSIVVVFDNIYKMVHYINEPPQINPKHYLFDSLRNITNPYNYEFQSEKVNNHTRRNTHHYYFTEQDYLDAKP